MSRLAGVVLLIVSATPTLAQSSAKEKLDREAMRTTIRAALPKFQAPGLALAVVVGEESFVEGFGVRELGREAAVTPDTIFALASLTKAFTAASIGLLVDDGKADWDDPVRKHLDWFRLHDPLADREVTLRDLLCHRTGLARHDYLWARAPWSVEESVRRMAHLEPTHSFRARYEYNNLAYLAAGLAVEKTAGQPWPTFVQKRLLEPLGMNNAVFTASQAQARQAATPHRRDRRTGKHHPIAWYPDDQQIRASGSLKASASDLIPWLRLHLNGGIHEGKRLLSAEVVAEMHRPQIVVPLSPALQRHSESTQSSYGLGWFVRDYRGWGMLEHGGANEGFRGRVVLIPRAKLGIALLTNCEETRLVEALAYTLVDQILGLKEGGWIEQAQKQTTPSRKPPTAKKGTHPSRELEAYAGTYRDPAYGELRLRVKDRRLHLSWSSFQVPLTHFHYDTFQICEEAISLDQELLTFSLNADGEVARVRFLNRTFHRAVK